MFEVQRKWRDLGRGDRLLVAALLVPLIPVAYLLLNNYSCEFGLDRSEYEQLAQINRVYANKPIYVPMTFEFVPITYTPLYWQVCGWLWKVTGPGFLAPRLVCLLSTAVLLWVVARFLWAVTQGDLLLTVAGVMNVLLVSLLTGVWLLVISNNALHFALTVAGFYCLRSMSAWSLLMAAVCLSLGALAKQTGLAYVVAGGLFVLLKEPRKSWAYAAPALLVCGGSLALLQSYSEGCFYKIIVQENLGPGWVFSRLVSEVWVGQFLGQEAILFLLSLWPLARSRTLRGAWDTILSPEYVMAGSGILVTSIAQPKLGSNNLHAVVAITGLVVCGWQGLCIALQDLRDAWMGARLRLLAVVLQSVVLAVPAWQQASMFFIDDFDRERYAEIANVFKRGYTVLYHFPYITSSFGYPEAGHQGTELCRWVDGRWSYANKPDFLSEPYREQRFDYVILVASVIDQDDPQIQAILNNYSVVRQLSHHPTKPNTVMLRFPIFVLKAKRLL